MYSFQVKVPGKLFIAGEYAVTEPGEPSIVIAVNRYIYANVIPNDENHLSLSQIGLDHLTWKVQNGKVIFSEDSEKLAFIQNAIFITYRYLKEYGIEPRPFSLTITSELDSPSGKKYGIGSSAAVVVAIITAMLYFNKIDAIPFTKETIYKLAAMAHFQTQGNGSCADIAAATYGGWLLYSTFDAQWLLDRIHENISSLLAETWPNLFIQSILPPQDLYLCVGWTKKAAATGPMVREVQKLKTNNPSLYEEFLQNSRKAVERILEGFQKQQVDQAICGLRENRHVLRKLDEWTKVNIETVELKKLIHIAGKYGSGKSSGAGGGDCGIAFVDSLEKAAELQKEWLEAAIEPLDLEVASTGTSIIIKD